MNTKRNMLFISHASEDYEFTQWLALQLATQGYGVWCDLTKLLGGENWPNEINKALQTRTIKFLFVLSKSSNEKTDPLGELETARSIMSRESLSNFIVPLKIDDIKRDEVDYRLQSIQHISFSPSWAAGLKNLLELLKEEKILKHQKFNPNSVNSWWKHHGTESCKVINESENLISNRFPILSYPDNIYAHYVGVEPKLYGFIKYPTVPYRKYILSFTPSDILKHEPGIKSEILKSHTISINSIMLGDDKLFKNVKVGNYYLTRLFNQALKKAFVNWNLKQFRLSKDECYYFDKDLLQDGRIIYKDNGNLNSLIKLWGKFKDEKWHWAVRFWFQKEPTFHYSLHPHILVNGKKGTRPAPKAAYKSWRNNTWRDRLVATAIHMAENNDEIIIDIGNSQNICVSKNPIIYSSPFSYEEPIENEDDTQII